MTDLFGESLIEAALIEKIVTRIVPMARRGRVEDSRDYWLELLADCHLSHGLCLEALYTAPDAAFAADVFGIRRFYERRARMYLTEWRPSCCLNRGPSEKLH